MKRNQQYAVVLGVLALAFLLRVVGQLFVAPWEVRFLPPMSEWYSGLLPYFILLPVQVLILAIQARILRDIWRDSGFYSERRPRLGSRLCRFSYVYFAAMVVRYVLTMTFYPERRRLGGSIPIFFHWVLAGYLFTLGQYYRRKTLPPRRVP